MRQPNRDARYIAEHFAPEDDALRAIRASAPPELQGMMLSAPEAALLHWLAALIQPLRAMEIGSFVGYSTLWLARALPPQGVLHAIEAHPRHIPVLRANLQHQPNIRIHAGRALDMLSLLAAEGPFDLIFIDADKPHYPDYLAWAEAHLRPGGMVLLDNTLRFGPVEIAGLPPEDQAARTAWEAVRRANAHLCASPQWRSMLLPTQSGLTASIKVY